MSRPDAYLTHRHSVPALVATALLAHDLPDSSPAERESAARYVDDSLRAMPDVTRAGVRIASAGVYVVLSLMGAAPYRRLRLERQAQLADRITRVRLPLVGEFGRLARGLGLVSVIERRTGAKPAS